VKKPTKKQLLTVGGVVLILGGAAAFGLLSSKLIQPPKQEQKQTTSGLPQQVDDIQNLRLQGKTDEAAKKADTLLAQSDLDAQTKYLLYLDKANGSFDAKKYDDALASFKAAAAVKETADIYTRIGETYYLLDKKPDAKTAYEKAITLVDKNSPVADSQKRDLQQRIDLIDGKVEQ
jgi:tetratricopeptide (TPR) repeat protein